MYRWLCYLLLRLMGWKIVGSRPDVNSKFIVISTPHTSNSDWLIGYLGLVGYGYSPSILIKKEAFKGIKGWFLKRMGSIPVDRKSGSTGLILQLKQLFARKKRVALTITPEGTRSFSGNWITGFYHMAIGTGVPIYLGYMNYRTKQMDFGLRFEPTGNEEADFAAIRAWYADKPAIGKLPLNGHQEVWPKGQGLDDPEYLAEFKIRHAKRMELPPSA